MSARWLSLQLPRWPIQRLALRARRRGEPALDDRPLALVAPGPGGPRLVATDAAAEAAGLAPGLLLTDARAIRPDLRILPADPAADARALEALALWCTRWSPRVAVDGADGVMLDVTGCAHLWGGEAGLLEAVRAAFAIRGLELRAALASGRLAARLWARHGPGGILADRRLLEDLPVAALELDPERTAALRRLGLRTLGRLRALPRAGLARRFGLDLPARLDALFLDGAAEPPFVPLSEPARFAARLAWPEPIGVRPAIEAACRRLLGDLAAALEAAGRGARTIRAGFHRVDGALAVLEVRTARPSRDPAHLFRLLRERLDRLELGDGVELLLIEAIETAALPAEQTGIGEPVDEAATARLVDRLAARLGAARVLRAEPVASHVPERRVRWCAAGAQAPAGAWSEPRPRPLRLLVEPVPVEALAVVPDGPPIRLVGRSAAGRVVAARGPERILPEWWRPADRHARPRDLWWIRLAEGEELWLAREGTYGDGRPPVWRLLGRFI